MTRGELELRSLVDQALGLRDRGSPYFVDACQAIVDWHEHRYLRFLEHEQEELARLVRLLRDTDPAGSEAT